MSFSKPKTCKYILSLFKHQTFAKILFPHAQLHEITKPKSAVHSPVTKVNIKYHGAKDVTPFVTEATH